MKYYSRLKVYKARNVKFDPGNMIATSYQWWEFVKRINGKIVFNDYRYSPSTGRHQSKVGRVLSDLGVKVDLYIESPQGLQNLIGARNYNLELLGKALYNQCEDSAKYRLEVVTFLNEVLNIDLTDQDIEDAIDNAALNDLERLSSNYHQRKWNEKRDQLKLLEQTLYDKGIDTPDISPNLVSSVANELNIELTSEDVVRITEGYRYPSYLRDQLKNKKFNNELNEVLA